MPEIFTITLHGLQHDLARMDSIAMNLSNAQTVGYKRDIHATRPFADFVTGPAGAAADNAGNAAGRMAATDFRPAPLKATGQSLDVALAGEGFFEIGSPAGPAFTRQGNFQIDARGRLVTGQGYPVMGKSGEITLPSTAIRIDAAGNIFDAAGVAADDAPPLAQLRIVLPDAPDRVQRLGDGLFGFDGGSTVMADSAVQARQGHLENSNVSAMQEMVQLMQTMRHAESMQKITQAYDDMLGTALRKLGDA